MGTYSRGTYVTLPTDDADLSNVMTAGEISDVATINNVFVGQNLSAQIAAMMFKNTCSASLANLVFVGQSDRAPSLSPITLEAYNYSTAAWVGQATNAAAATNATCTLAASLGATQYLSPGGYTTGRVYQSAGGPGIAYIEGSTTAAGNGASGVVVNKPAGVVDGHYIVVAIAEQDDNGTDPSAPAGWTKLAKATHEAPAGTFTQMYIYGKIASSEGSSWTWTFTNLVNGNRAVAVALAFSGVNASTPDDQKVANWQTNAYTCVVEAVITTVDDEWSINFIAPTGQAGLTNRLPVDNVARKYVECTDTTFCMDGSTRPIASAGSTGTDQLTDGDNFPYLEGRVTLIPA